MQFAYDNANRRTSITLANGVVQTYGYDDANQLISITYTKAGTTLGDLVYTYDTAGRRVKVSGSLARTNLPAAVNSAAYNANNQLTAWAGVTHTYDLNGNLTDDGSKSYTWNARDQLTALSGGMTASFSYDGTGRRKSKTVSGTQTGFLYDGLNFVQELTATTPKANLITGRLDELFLRKETSATRHPMTDALGSVIALADPAGAMSTEYTYEPYGSTTSSGAADTNSQSYTGREDDGTGLRYYRARYYAPTVARFIAQDPLGRRSGQSNDYAYVAGDPLRYSDPLGLYRSPGGIFSDALLDSQQPGLGGPHNGPQDAYRHCLASCEMARENGQLVAQCFGLAWEKVGDWFNNQERGERSMDDFNNSMGFALGKGAGSYLACQQLCMAALNNNQLRTYRTRSSKGYW